MPEIPEFTSTLAIFLRTGVSWNSDFVIGRFFIIVSLFIEYKTFYKFRFIVAG
jgi:hypothetical protein